jgi:hypothetical protein
MLLDRAAFLSERPLSVQRVDVRGLIAGDDAHVFVRMITAGERDALEAEHAKAKERNLRARIVAWTACDELGNLLFLPTDVPMLSKLPTTVLDPIVKAANAINKTSDVELEELEKNS